MEYKQKYIKYKTKYIKLKGGSTTILQLIGSGSYGIALKVNKDGNEYIIKNVQNKELNICKILNEQKEKNKYICQGEQFDTTIMTDIKYIYNDTITTANNFEEIIQYIIKTNKILNDSNINIWIKMDYCGITLKEHLFNKENIDNIDKFKKYMTQIHDGLQYLHNLQIYHCDFHLGNILIDIDDNIKIIDFGQSITSNDIENDINSVLLNTKVMSKLPIYKVIYNIINKKKGHIIGKGITTKIFIDNNYDYINNNTTLYDTSKITDYNVLFKNNIFQYDYEQFGRYFIDTLIENNYIEIEKEENKLIIIKDTYNICSFVIQLMHYIKCKLDIYLIGNNIVGQDLLELLGINANFIENFKKEYDL